jgi:hypothetical protein
MRPAGLTLTMSDLFIIRLFTKNFVPLQGPKNASPRVALELAVQSLESADLSGGVLQHCFLSTSELKKIRDRS